MSKSLEEYLAEYIWHPLDQHLPWLLFDLGLPRFQSTQSVNQLLQVLESI